MYTHLPAGGAAVATGITDGLIRILRRDENLTHLTPIRQAAWTRREGRPMKKADLNPNSAFGAACPLRRITLAPSHGVERGKRPLSGLPPSHRAPSLSIVERDRG